MAPTASLGGRFRGSGGMRGADFGGGGSRWVGLAVVVAAHIAVLAALLTYQPVREALGMKPLMVEFINPPAPPAPPEPPKETPKPPEVKIVKPVVAPPQPKQIITAQTTAPAPEVVQPPAPPMPAPPVDAAPPPPPAPPAPPSQPRIVSGVSYINAPSPVYPPLARRANEQGKVLLRVIIDPTGHAEKADIQKSSGSSRLDEAARTAVMQALYRPYVENGVPVTAQVTIPITFSLSD